jgi:tyrosyl-tRNA synthetase
LNSGEQLTIYLGIDPTGPTLHMGNMIPLIKLSQLQKLGHKIILLIGDFTARIGDPDKSQARSVLTHAEVLDNAKLYQGQASAVLDFDGENPAELKYNGEWLDTMNFADVLNLASQMTVQRMLDRDMFRKRFYGVVKCSICGDEQLNSPIEFNLGDPYDKSQSKNGDQTVSQLDRHCSNGHRFERTPKIYKKSPIYIHEFMYPLMQGYDSVAMNVDGEVGGNDQTFNMLVGRDLLKNQNPPKEKFVIPMKLLVDNNGDKMGKTTGNMLSFLDSSSEKFKKIMTWTDGMILNAFELLTEADLEPIAARLNSDENPRDIKFDLAHTVVAHFHSEELAISAKQSWVNDVQKDNVPTDIPEIELLENIIETLAVGTGESKTQTRRSLSEGAVKLDGEKISEETILKSGDVIQIGKKRWFSIK